MLRTLTVPQKSRSCARTRFSSSNGRFRLCMTPKVRSPKRPSRGDRHWKRGQRHMNLSDGGKRTMCRGQERNRKPSPPSVRCPTSKHACGPRWNRLGGRSGKRKTKKEKNETKDTKDGPEKGTFADI